MRIHSIVDYSYLYYKYKFQLDSGKIRRLKVLLNSEGDMIEGNTEGDEIARAYYSAKELEKVIACADMPMCNYTEEQLGIFKMELIQLRDKLEAFGTIIEKDISQIYYTIKEIEGFRQKLEKCGHQVTVSVCCDMPSKRKETSEEATEGENAASIAYKSNRVKRLGEEDFENMRIVRSLLAEAGHNVYILEATEADDLVSHLIRNFKDSFDYTIMYTSDADLLVNIDTNVGAQRFKATKGYEAVDINNFSDYLSAEYKCNVPYNALMLYKSTVGDKSDCINGIVKFGPKGFDKLINYLDSKDVEWSEQGDYEQTANLLELCRNYLTEDQIRQANESLSMVRPMILETESLVEPNKVSNKELRVQSYSKYNMKSLMV